MGAQALCLPIRRRMKKNIKYVKNVATGNWEKFLPLFGLHLLFVSALYHTVGTIFRSIFLFSFFFFSLFRFVFFSPSFFSVLSLFSLSMYQARWRAYVAYGIQYDDMALLPLLHYDVKSLASYP